MVYRRSAQEAELTLDDKGPKLRFYRQRFEDPADTTLVHSAFHKAWANRTPDLWSELAPPRGPEHPSPHHAE